MIRYANITFVILTYRDIVVNIIFRVNYSFMVDSRMHIEYRFLHFVFNLDERHRFKCCSFIFCNNKSHFIAYITNYRIQDESIIGRWLWICLTCQCKASIRHIFMCEDCFNAWNQFSFRCIDRFNARLCMRATKYLNNERIFWNKITCIRWFTRQDTFIVNFVIGLTDVLIHYFRPPSKNLRTPRSCDS